ncbi:sporulation phosphorelay system protein KapB, partial [Bacillus velezensis]|uniref:sporulation phosphorelay system protein KapB n=1 Tax=Bacillus velezensis TaxID=492670 RepID=UPI0028D85FB4
MTEVRGNEYLVKIKGVLTHAAEGDVHDRKEGDVGFFDERRGVGLGEERKIGDEMVKGFDGEVGDYRAWLEGG